MADEHPSHSVLLVVVVIEPEATSSPLMVQCSRHAIPPAIEVDLTDRRAHDLPIGLLALRATVLTRRRLRTSLEQRSLEVVDPH